VNNRCRLTLQSMLSIICIFGLTSCTNVVPTPSETLPSTTESSVPIELRNSFFMENQIIVTGPREDIENAISEYNRIHSDQPLGAPVGEIRLSYLADQGPNEVSTYPDFDDPNKILVQPLFSPNEYENLVMRLY
jgi:hypothetical protein